MNSWNFNELTQQDLYDFKMCKHTETGRIYGIKDSSMCQSGKEITQAEQTELVKKAQKGDKQAAAELQKLQAAKKDLGEKKKAETKAKAEAEAKAKEKERESKCKSGELKGKKACGDIKKEKGGKGGKGK